MQAYNIPSSIHPETNKEESEIETINLDDELSNYGYSRYNDCHYLTKNYEVTTRNDALSDGDSPRLKVNHDESHFLIHAIGGNANAKIWYWFNPFILPTIKLADNNISRLSQL